MMHAQALSGPDHLTLQAEMAGLALGCHFSSSDEYEAALIAERRKAGVYRQRVWKRPVSWMLAAVAITAFAFFW